MKTRPTNGPLSNDDRRGQSRSGEDTLRLIAGLPAPAGIEDRVKAGLRSAPETGRILLWRDPLRPAGGWMYSSIARGAAAAAIVCLIAGGGWRIYSHVQPPPAAKVVPMQSTSNGFSNANAVRVSQTLDRPVLKHPVNPAPEVNALEKTPAPSTAVPAPKRKKPIPRSSPVQ